MVQRRKYGKPQPRKHRVTVVFNDSEMKAIERYQKRYKRTNRSRLIREILLKHILARFSADTPTLFD